MRVLKNKKLNKKNKLKKTKLNLKWVGFFIQNIENFKG